jgi:hypothetical protein
MDEYEVRIPTGLFLGNQIPAISEQVFDIGIPMRTIPAEGRTPERTQLFLGTLGARDYMGPRSLARVSWDPEAAHAEAQIVLPHTVTEVLLPDTRIGKRAYHTIPWNVLTMSATVAERSMSLHLANDHVVIDVDNTIFDHDEAFRTVAMEGVWRAIVGKIIRRRKTDATQ